MNIKTVNMKSKPLTSAQIKPSARSVRWSAAGSRARVRGWCCDHPQGGAHEAETSSLTAANDLAIRHALEAAGIEFIDKNGGGPGVRLKKPPKERS